MAEDSIGFDASGGISESQFSNVAPFLGSFLPTVNQVNTKKVTQGSASMTVDVASGVSSAFGVRHNITTITNLPIATVSLTGGTRWDAVVLRYNWSNNTVTAIVVPGTAAVGAQKIAPTLNNTPGVLFDQLLALVKATNGSTALEIEDERGWASKYHTYPTVDALPPAATVPYATVAYVIANKTTYRVFAPGGTLTWVPDSTAVSEIQGAAVLAAATGWTVDGTHVNRCLLGPYWRQIDVEVRRSGAEINAANSDGNFNDSPVVVLTSACRPDRPMPARVNYITTDGKEFGGDARVDPDGTLTLLGGAIARNVAQSNAVGFVSLRASITFGRRTA